MLVCVNKIIKKRSRPDLFGKCLEKMSVVNWLHTNENWFDLTIVIKRTMVVFSVKAEEGGAYGPFDTDRTMTYNTVITNIGNAYNVSTGVFTAPVAGVYYFTFFYHAGGEHVSKLILHKNKEPVVMTSDHNGKVTRCNSETADNGGNAVFLKLEKGDKVSVQLPAGAHVWASEGHTTFSGFLVNSC
uniref:Complement C1q tumor necrosis factor-related protein 3-like n=1 Tax=Seriola dumerili TaxID=41447 RepID=A0A3B4UKN4_SERDU